MIKIQQLLRDKERIKLICLITFIMWLLGLYAGFIYEMLFSPKMKDFFDVYGLTYFFLDYSQGFIPRGFFGEVIKPFVTAHYDNLYHTLLYYKVILAGVYVVGISFVFIKLSKKLELSTFLIVMFAFIHPYYFFDRTYSFRTDNWWEILVPLMVLGLYKSKSKIVDISLILVLSTICMLCHHAFIFVFAPLICAILLLKKEYTLFFVYGFVLAIEFCILSFGVSYDAEALYQMVIDKVNQTDLIREFSSKRLSGYIGWAITLEFLSTHATQLRNNEQLLSEYPVHIMSLVACLFFSLISLRTIIKVLKEWVKQSKFNILSILMMTVPYFCLLAFTIDCERWFMLYLMSFGILVIWLVCKEKIQIKMNTFDYWLALVSLGFNCCIFTCSWY